MFHAAALKHVPLLERDWDEGVKTTCSARSMSRTPRSPGAAAMVMISTDKAIEPISMLGATKRFAEMYCQALDGDLRRVLPPPYADAVDRGAFRQRARLEWLRGAEVQGANRAGGPVTVTHPDMVRYFMTIREACDLVVTAASHALSPNAATPPSTSSKWAVRSDRRTCGADDQAVRPRARPRCRGRV